MRGDLAAGEVRRVITLVTSDLKGSTALGERLEKAIATTGDLSDASAAELKTAIDATGSSVVGSNRSRRLASQSVIHSPVLFTAMPW